MIADAPGMPVPAATVHRDLNMPVAVWAAAHVAAPHWGQDVTASLIAASRSAKSTRA
jgi:hypothetical protein